MSHLLTLASESFINCTKLPTDPVSENIVCSLLVTKSNEGYALLLWSIGKIWICALRPHISENNKVKKWLLQYVTPLTAKLHGEFYDELCEYKYEPLPEKFLVMRGLDTCVNLGYDVDSYLRGTRSHIVDVVWIDSEHSIPSTDEEFNRLTETNTGDSLNN